MAANNDIRLLPRYRDRTRNARPIRVEPIIPVAESYAATGTAERRRRVVITDTQSRQAA